MKSISTFSVRLISLVFNYAILIMINNKSGTELYGQYAYSFSFIIVYASILRFGFDTIIMRHENAHTSNSEILPPFYFTLLISTVVSTLILVCFDIEWKILVAAHLLCLTWIFAELIRRKNQVIAYIFYSTGFYLIIQSIGFGLFGATFDTIDTILLFSFLINLLAILAYIRVACPMKLVFRPRVPSRALLSDAFNSSLMNSSTMMNNHATIFILSFLTSKEILGVFSIARRIANGVALPCQILNAENAPKFIEKRKSPVEFNAYLKKQMNLFFFVGFLLPLVLIPLTPVILKFIHISSDNVKTYYFVLTAFLISRAIDGFTGPTFNLIKIFGNLRRAMIIQVSVYTTMLVAILILGFVTDRFIPEINVAVSTALIMTAFLSSVNVIYTFILRKHHDINLTALYFFRS